MTEGGLLRSLALSKRRAAAALQLGCGKALHASPAASHGLRLQQRRRTRMARLQGAGLLGLVA
jgi:hypothetical protein